MSLIQVLGPEISNKIAAGEVVERPASVVKELVENSIDAGATKITVEIKNGGVSMISVTDNGSGMHSDDAQIAFLRHATSKIHSEEDLDAIYTLGFRGEALSSIGAVSEAVIYTKRREDDYGTVVTCEGGEIIASDEGGMSDGTKIIVRNLFYNTPARMKFLKKDSTESGYVTDIMNRFVLAHPEIAFRYIKNGKDVITSAGDADLKNAVYSVYGRDYANNLINVDYETDGIRVKGAVGNTNLSRPNRSFQSFFVNKRSIRSPLIIRAVEEAFKNQIMIGKFPVAILNIEINPAMIDINVHPTKLEVKFSDEKKIYDAVFYGTKNALYAIPGSEKNKAEFNPRINPFLLKTEDKKTAVEPEKRSIVPRQETPAVEVKQSEVKPFIEVKSDPLEVFRKKEANEIKPVFSSPESKVVIPEPVKIPDVEVKSSGAPVKEPEISNRTQTVSKSENIQLEMAVTDNKPADLAPSFKIIGQIFETYIIAQRGNEMLLVDQHAAHERIKYEQLLKDIEIKQCYPQMLLEPVVIKLDNLEFAAFESNADTIFDLGFEADVFGENEIIVRAAPQEIEWGDVEDLLIELLSELASSKKEIISSKLQRMIYTIACKAAVKANYSLSQAEMEGLLKSVFALENVNTCPHGRPITITMTKKDLEKLFKRIV